MSTKWNITRDPIVGIPGHPLWRGRVFRIRAEPSGALKVRDEGNPTHAEAHAEAHARWREILRKLLCAAQATVLRETWKKFEALVGIQNPAIQIKTENP